LRQGTERIAVMRRCVAAAGCRPAFKPPQSIARTPRSHPSAPRIIRAFLVEEAKVVKLVLKAAAAKK
jgi:hypothetical protein